MAIGHFIKECPTHLKSLFRAMLLNSNSIKSLPRTEKHCQLILNKKYEKITVLLGIVVFIKHKNGYFFHERFANKLYTGLVYMYVNSMKLNARILPVGLNFLKELQN